MPKLTIIFEDVVINGIKSVAVSANMESGSKISLDQELSGAQVLVAQVFEFLEKIKGNGSYISAGSRAPN